MTELYIGFRGNRSILGCYTFIQGHVEIVAGSRYIFSAQTWAFLKLGSVHYDTV